jgi:LPS-assembly lipoprotein
MTAPRRHFLQGLWAVPLTAGLSACGFQLRSVGNYPFKTLYANFSISSPLGVELRRNLLGTGRIEVWSEPAQMFKADVILDILSEERQQVVVGLNALGQVRELQLRLRIRFRLRTPDGVNLIDSVELAQQRDLSFNETAALSKEIEQGMMYRDMQTDIVQQIMRRLAMVKLPSQAAAVPALKP